MDHKTEQELADGLESYLTYGYVDPDYINSDVFDSQADQAGLYLFDLSFINHKLAEHYYKKILESTSISNDFFKSICFSSLLLSESEWQYALDFLNKNHKNLSVPILKEALFYFYCAKNDPEAHQIPEELIKKLQTRYQDIKNHVDAKFHNLDEEYNNFVNAYNLR